jgi:hypothetical protein
MDKGALEKEKLLKIKHIVNRSKWKKRQQQLLHTVQSPQHSRAEPDPLPNEEILSSNMLWPSPTQGTFVRLDGEAVPQDNCQIQSCLRDLSTFNESMWDESFYNTLFPAESFHQDDAILALNQHLSDAATEVENADMESTSVLSRSPRRASGSAKIVPTAHEAKSRWIYGVSGEDIQLQANGKTPLTFYKQPWRACNHDIHLLRKSTSSNQDDSSSFIQKSSTSGALEHHASWPADSGSSILYGDTEDILFMDYLDHVFYIQYPFYHLSTRQGRGWLFSILRRVKSVYHASLALSEYHHYSTVLRNISIASLRANDRHYGLALREMQLSIAQSNTWSGTPGLIRTVETLTCILQLLFWEVSLLLLLVSSMLIFICQMFGGGRENWQMHLAAAANLVPALVQARKTSITAGSDHIDRQQEESTLDSEDDSAIRFLLGSFISFDIISCASTRSSPFLGLDHKLILERAGIHLENLTGCENWAMVFIFEISLLDKWKKEAERAYKLSIVELTKRGSQIEERLQERLADIENRPKSSIGASSGNSSGILSASVHTEITKIFALSAMTYLHVVISGAYPEVPEITKSVSKTIHAFQSLTDAKLLQNMAWPFCISGCLAFDRKQHTVFRDLVSTAEITQSTVGTCLEALKIMEECWEVRKKCSDNYDWVSVMDKRGQYVLLG